MRDFLIQIALEIQRNKIYPRRGRKKHKHKDISGNIGLNMGESEPQFQTYIAENYFLSPFLYESEIGRYIIRK